MNTYCIDTSALIDGWKDYPPEHFGVWDEIQSLINNECLISQYHVLGELKVKEDDLYKWCNEKSIFFVVLLKILHLLKEKSDLNILILNLKNTKS